MNVWETYESALQSLEEATKQRDVQTTCNVLQFFRKLHSQEAQNWSSDVVRRLWRQAVCALDANPLPEMAARACQLIEVLGRQCKSCTEANWERVFDRDAPKQVIKVMDRYPTDLSVQSSALRALLSMSGCMICRRFYDKETQDLMGEANAIDALTRSLVVLQKVTTTTQFETNANKLARLAIDDAVQTLHYICLMNKDNTMYLASLKRLPIITTSIEDDLNELTVQEHGCMVLAELVISAPTMSSQEIKECVTTVTNVVRLQMQEKFIEVARAAVWSLARMTRYRLHPSKNSTSDGMETLWQLMQEQGLSMIVGMMQSCQLKNDPLVKHCLDFIAVVCDITAIETSMDARISEGFKKAREAVYKLFIDGEDARIKAVALKTLSAITPQQNASLHHQENFTPAIFLAMRTALERGDAKNRDTFCTQVFGLTLISHATTALPTVISQTAQTHQYIQDVHEAIGYVVTYIEEGGEEFLFDSRSNRDTTVENTCCRNACHCCYIHEKCKKCDVLGGIMAGATILSSVGGDGINSVDRDGLTVLHKLAKFGDRNYLQVFIGASDEGLDTSIKTPEGRSAWMLAHTSRDPTSAALLEDSTPISSPLDREIVKEQLVEAETGAPKKHRTRSSLSAIHVSHPPAGAPVHDSAGEDEQKGTMAFIEEDEYEKALAERRQQLEDMDASVRRSVPRDRRLHFDEKAKGGGVASEKNSTLRFYGSAEKETTLMQSTSVGGDKSSGLGTSVSIGSIASNTSSPDPLGLPPSSYDDRIVDSSLSVFQRRDNRAGMNLAPGDDKTSGSWHSLFTATTAENNDGMSNSGWSKQCNMLSSSSGQNNQPLLEGDRQGTQPQPQPLWTSLSQPTRSSGAHIPAPGAHDATEGLSNLVVPSPSTKCPGEDDGVDDTQILSWLSSEITGLIGNGSSPNKTPTEVSKARDICSTDFAVPPHPVQNPLHPFEHFEDSTAAAAAKKFQSVDPMATAASPFYAGNPMATGASPYIHQPTVNSFVHSHSSPWGQSTAVTNTVMMDPRLVPQSELNNREGRSSAVSAQTDHFWHTEENDIPSKHLWLGNLNTRLPRSVLKSVFEEYGPIEDVVTFPGRMYAFVNFINPEDAQRAAKELDNMTFQVLTGNRKLVIKFRPNRKALGRVGDLMPGVASIEDHNTGSIAPSISVPVFRSPDLSSPPQSENFPHHGNGASYIETGQQERRSDELVAEVNPMMAVAPCRHLWLGNVCVRPSKTILFSLFSRYGPVESVRVFPGKTYAFVNFYGGEHAHRAKEALDGKVLSAITGTKPLVVRFQREGSGPVGWSRAQENFNTGATSQSIESSQGKPARRVEMHRGQGGLVVGGGHASSCLLRNGLQRGEYRPIGGTEGTGGTSLSPEEYQGMSRPTRVGLDGHVYETHQRLSQGEQEVLWSEAMSKDMTGAAVFTSGGYPVEQQQSYRGNHLHPNATVEASSIGQLTRTLSAATFGKGHRPSAYNRAPAVDRNAAMWNQPPALNGGSGRFDEPGLQSSLSATLNSSHSFGGFEGNGYNGSFFNPNLHPAHGGSLGSSHSWINPATEMQRLPESAGVMNVSLDQNLPFQTSMSSQAVMDGHDGSSSNTMPPQSMHPQIMGTSGGSILNAATASIGMSEINNQGPQQSRTTTGPGLIPSAAMISCEKSTIW